LSIRRWALCALVALCPSLLRAQYGDDEHTTRTDNRYPGAKADQGPPPRYIIQNPTASTLPKGYFDASVWVGGRGGLLAATSMGFSNRFLLGVSYGAEGLLGTSEPIWNERVSFQAKLQLIPESLKFPAITLGYDDQGYGPYLADFDRYTVKSKGVYAVITKNFYTLSVATGFHGGVNYSFETQDNDNEPDVFFGWDFHYNQEWSLLLEYSLGLNDNQSGSPVGKGRGYLNLGLRWEYSRDLVMEAILSDLVLNRKDAEQIGRQLRIVYLSQF
jgi:hypothetical protein